ncbi:UDP-N-acetylmuramate dehydrogenase [Candidatus Uhrbacteria bacterium]|nr:UDP-N-acetylmuramate dehydrogenase [Candidatus Uhrbacteria bacterium]
MNQLTDQQIEAVMKALPQVKQDESMSLHTYLKIGGPARFFYLAKTLEDVIHAVSVSREAGIPFSVIGGGSNILVSDEGYEGLVIQVADTTYKIEGNHVRIAAGAFTALIARASVEAGLEGFEWGVGVPGTIGGAVYGNAGCFGGEIKDHIETVDALRLADAVFVTYSNVECRFGYRDSHFKHEPHIILSTTLNLKMGDKIKAKEKITEIMSKRKETQPQGAFTAGCLFKNASFQDEKELEKLKHEAEIPLDFLQNKRIPAGWLIDKLGLKGKTIGRAQVSPIHGNFLVNLGQAKAQDVIQLSSLIKMKIRDEYGILLEDEIQYVGF